MEIQIIKNSITTQELLDIAKEQFGDLVKAVVDVENRIMAVGGELHADEEVVLMDQGSKREYIWGINIYPAKVGEERIEFDSMVNLKPSYNNRSRGIEDTEVKKKIREIVKELVVEST